MVRTRPPYCPEFRWQIVDLVRAGRDPDDRARRTGAARSGMPGGSVRLRPGEGRHDTPEAGPDGSRVLTCNVWVTACSRGIAGRWGTAWAQTHRPPDAGGGPDRCQPSAEGRDDHAAGQRSAMRTGPRGSRCHGGRTEPFAHRTGSGRSGYGDRPATVRQRHPPQRSPRKRSLSRGKPVPVAGVWRTLPGSWRASLHGFGRRRLRQRHVRKLLRDTGMGVAGPSPVRISGRSKDGVLQLHRRLVQSCPPPFRVG